MNTRFYMHDKPAASFICEGGGKLCHILPFVVISAYVYTYDSFSASQLPALPIDNPLYRSCKWFLRMGPGWRDTLRETKRKEEEEKNVFQSVERVVSMWVKAGEFLFPFLSRHLR